MNKVNINQSEATLSPLTCLHCTQPLTQCMLGYAPTKSPFIENGWMNHLEV